MSQDTEQQGPSMVCATSAIDTGPARVGHVAGKITLPRTVELPTAIATGVGALVGAIVAATIPGGSIQKWVFSVLFFATVGYFLMNFSPMRGESLAKWLGLQVSTLRRSRMVNGRPVIIAIGSKVASREVLGEFRLVRSAVHVPVGAYDERGVFKSEKNRNLDPDARPAAEMGSHASRTAPPVVSHGVTSASGAGGAFPQPGSGVDTSPLVPAEVTPLTGAAHDVTAGDAPAWARMRGQQPEAQQSPMQQMQHPQAHQLAQPGPAPQPLQHAEPYVQPAPQAVPQPAVQAGLHPGNRPAPVPPSSAAAPRPGLPEGAPPWARQLTPEPEQPSKHGRRRKERGK